MVEELSEGLLRVSQLLEELSSRVSALDTEDQIDIGARMTAVQEHVKVIDGIVKDKVRKVLADRHGERPFALDYVVGHNMRARFNNSIYVTRFNMDAFKEQYPRMYARFSSKVHEPRILYRPR